MNSEYYDNAADALATAWIRQCVSNGWPVEDEVMDDIITFTIDMVSTYVFNKYGMDYDVLELAVQDAFNSREERLGEQSWFSEIVEAAGKTWDNEPPAWLKNDA